MNELITSGRVVDFILVVVAIEFIVLALHHRRTGRGVAPGAILPNLLAGTFLLLALRTASGSGHAAWVALFLLLALVSHLADLKRRWVR
ncbi:MAG: hypothetical protein ACREBN_05380 [Burkholderiaceae bacterium]